jgi:hypothetical protein
MADHTNELPQHVIALALGWPDQKRYIKTETEIAQIERSAVGEIDADRLETLYERRAMYVRKATAVLDA